MWPHGGAGGSPLVCRQARAYFKVTGALCKQSPSVGDQKQTPHLAPKSGGFWKAQAPGTGLADGCGFAHLLSTFPNAQLRVGHGIQVGAQGLWHISLHAWRWGRPQHRLGTDSITPQSRRLRLGKGEAAGRLFLARARSLGKGRAWIGSSDSTAAPHSLVPCGGSLAFFYHPQLCWPCLHRASTSSPSALFLFRRIQQLIS